MSRIRNHWPTPSLSDRGAVDGVVTQTAATWWTIAAEPGAYALMMDASGYKSFTILSNTSPYRQLGNANSQAANPRCITQFTVPADSTGFILQVQKSDTADAIRLSRPCVVLSSCLERLRELTGENLPYFDGSLRLP